MPIKLRGLARMFSQAIMRHLTVPLAVLFVQIVLAVGQSFTETYEHGPIPLDSSANLSFTVDLSSRTASLGLIVSADLSAETWVGIGISEPTSGSMLGADVALAEFLPNSTDECELTDRHVPSVPYPLLSTANGAPSAFPELDDCQDGWTIVSCQRNIDEGTIILEVSRSLDAEDPQDREIVPGLNNVIYAHGRFISYHGGNRASAKVTLYGDGPVGNVQVPVPADVSDNFTITATNYPVNEEQVTVYACTSAKIPVEKGKTRMIVGAEPIINATKEEHVHHLTLFLCSGAEYAKMVENTIECTTGEDIPGPLGNPLGGCATFIYGWAKGAGRIVLPEEAGFLVTEENSYLVMETHYDNPDLEGDAFDNSGVRVFLTDTPRENEAGSILVGDSFVSLEGQKIQSGFKYQFSCPSECTEKFAEPVNLFSSFLHMHRTGVEIYNNKFSEDDTFVENINKVNFWSDSFQNNINIDKQLRPGEQLQVTCRYDTRKLPDTVFGVQTQDEMCMDFVGYWPVQRIGDDNIPINMCTFGAQEGVNDTFTFCGDMSTAFGSNATESILPVPNPTLNDTRGAPTDFGNSPDTCPVETGEPSSGTPSQTGGPVTSGPIVDGPSSTDEAGVVGTETAEPQETDDSTEDEGVCFPSYATVKARNGRKRMDELEVGDEVLVGSGTYSPVFMFTHKDRYTRYLFVRLSTAKQSITLTRGHYLYVNNELRRADAVAIGDKLRLGAGDEDVVEKVEMIRDEGLYNPQTLHGDIVVDGIVTTCYTVRVSPWRAHALLAPLRWAFGLVGIDASRIVVS